MGISLFPAHAIVITYQLPPTHEIEACPNYHNISYMCVCVCVCVGGSLVFLLSLGETVALTASGSSARGCQLKRGLSQLGSIALL
jgi:hypothetical protein